VSSRAKPPALLIAVCNGKAHRVVEERDIDPAGVTFRAAERRYGRQIRAGAEELVQTGATVVRLSNVQLLGRIVGFWRGDSVLHLETIGPGRQPVGMSLPLEAQAA
jgi:hypothetical protein